MESYTWLALGLFNLFEAFFFSDSLFVFLMERDCFIKGTNVYVSFTQLQEFNLRKFR